jgi:hypothetical protein
VGAEAPTTAAVPVDSRLPPAPPPIGPPELALKQVAQRNLNAHVPPQCYTKTKDDAGKLHNPCSTCHLSSRAPNYINDGEFQLVYDFAPRARSNRWSNVFVDWSKVGPAIGDAEITAYIRQSNYFAANGDIVLAKRLSPPPPEWDHLDDGVWRGFVPDARFHFDSQGFDRLADGGYTGWRAYAYYPLPGTFWPTNGSIGDALIRLPAAFRTNEAGQFDAQVYQANLAIVEALILRRDMSIEPTREAAFGVDLDLDGVLGTATSVRFLFPAAAGRGMSFVGKARAAQAQGRVHLAAGLFPEGTEFLHSVRYLDSNGARVAMAPRLKELRYARKADWWSYERLDKRARVEAIAKVDSPAEIRSWGGDIERGVSNGQGWWYQGFIEDGQGALRPQTFEETVYCVGCHGGLGRTDDGNFSFGRRFSAMTFQRGWFHWSQRGLAGVPDQPIHAGTSSEYVSYLEENGAGDEFRQNQEVLAKFFDARGRLKPELRARLTRDVSELLLPSPTRAMALNKAYRALVRTQRFSEGRDVVLGGARNVHRELLPGEKTGITAALLPGWELTRTAAQPAP